MGRKECCDFGQAPQATKGDGSSASLMIPGLVARGIEEPWGVLQAEHGRGGYCQ